MTFSEDGTNNAGFVQLTATGVKKGVGVQTVEEKQYQIEYISDDGSVGMVGVGVDGKAGEAIETVSMANVLKHYKVAKCRSKLLNGYPANSCGGSKDYMDLRDKSTIVFALDELHRKSKGMTYTCEAKPTQRLFASQACGVEGLCIVPLTTFINKTDTLESVMVTATLDGSTWKLGKQLTEKCVLEICLLRHVDDRTSASMVLKTMIAIQTR